MTRSLPGFGWILAGIVFVANPYFSIFDILPDFIGYAMILYGLGSIVHVFPIFPEAAEKIKILIVLSLIRLVSIPIVAGVTIKESPTMSLVVVFCVSLAELYVGWQMINSLFRGIAHTTDRFGCYELDRDANLLKHITRLLLLYKTVGDLLPELAVLGISEDEYINSTTDYFTQDYLALRNVLHYIFFVLISVSSICFILAWAEYLKRMKKNARYLQGLEETLRLYPEAPGRRIRRTAGTATKLLIVGCFLLWSVRIDGYILIPAFLGAVLIAVACQCYSAGIEAFEKEKPLWIGYAVLAAVSWSVQNHLVAKYYESGLPEGERGLFLFSIVISGVCASAAFALLIRLAKRLCTYVRQHCFAATDERFVRMSMEMENRKKALCYRIVAVGISAVFPLSCEVAEAATLFMSDITVTLFGIEQTLSLWGIFMLIRLAWAIFAADTTIRIWNRTKERYHGVT